MKALTLLNPWSYLMAIGAKKYESRSWKTSYRGELAITASKVFKDSDKVICLLPEFRKVLEADMAVPASYAYFINSLPSGCVVAVGHLSLIITSEQWMEKHNERTHGQEFSDQEKAFGNYEPRRFAWKFVNVVRLPEPVPCSGKQSIWDVPGSVEAQVRKQLAIAKESNKH